MNYQTEMNPPFPKISEIIDLPIEEQAKYADAICQQLVNDPILLGGMDEQPAAYHLWNSTSIGNAAYIILHCEDKIFVAYVNNQLIGFKIWYKSQNSEGRQMLNFAVKLLAKWLGICAVSYLLLTILTGTLNFFDWILPLKLLFIAVVILFPVKIKIPFGLFHDDDTPSFQ